MFDLLKMVASRLRLEQISQTEKMIPLKHNRLIRNPHGNILPQAQSTNDDEFIANIFDPEPSVVNQSAPVDAADDDNGTNEVDL